MADRSRMVQVLRNLLSNAEKYSSPDSAIEMWLAVEGRDVVFVVSDRGPGIEQEDLGRLFERFCRVRNRATRDIPSRGLASRR